MAEIFDKVVDFLNKPLPGTAKQEKAEKDKKPAKAEKAAAPADTADQKEAIDLQAELLKKDQELKRLQKEMKEEQQRKELEERRKQLEKLRRQYETEVAEEAKAHEETDDWTYTVVPGDSLWKISERFYGNGARWKEIYEANQDRIDNPNLIYPGQTFVIPGVDED